MSVPTIEKTDLLFSHTNLKMNGSIMGELLACTNMKELSSIEHYTGYRIAKHFPLIKSTELDISIEEIKGSDIHVPQGLQRIVHIIGKDHAWDWRRAMGITFLKGRLS